MSDPAVPCNCEVRGLYSAFEGSGHSPKNPREAKQAIGQMHDAELAAERSDTERPPGELSEYAVVRSVNWNLGLVVLELKMPHDLDELPNVDDEVRVVWLAPVPEAAE
jgi:hypothetical protein